MNPGQWVPLTKPIIPILNDGKYTDTDKDEEIKEAFVDQAATVNIVASIFSTLAAALCAAIIAMVFYWSYETEPTLFIAIFAGIMVMYTLTLVLLFAIKSGSFDALTFRYYLGSSVFVCVVNIIVAVYFGLKARNRMNSGYGGVRPNSSSSYQDLGTPAQY
jgi:hypothetical protein